MAIVILEDMDGDPAYVFRPFVHFLEDDQDYVLLNSTHVLSMNRPRSYLSDQYLLSVQSMQAVNQERVSEYEKAKAEGVRQFERAMEAHLTDSSESNVISFPDKETLH